MSEEQGVPFLASFDFGVSSRSRNARKGRSRASTQSKTDEKVSTPLSSQIVSTLPLTKCNYTHESEPIPDATTPVESSVDPLTASIYKSIEIATRELYSGQDYREHVEIEPRKGGMYALELENKDYGAAKKRKFPEQTLPYKAIKSVAENSSFASASSRLTHFQQSQVNKRSTISDLTAEGQSHSNPTSPFSSEDLSEMIKISTHISPFIDEIPVLLEKFHKAKIGSSGYSQWAIMQASLEHIGLIKALAYIRNTMPQHKL